ncbi:MAG: hypothetical protein HY043_21800 [Verrucomicrobia bacterium]|nr:hypothetical protein [Verrucomicrobiota bacterium]
MIRHVALVSEVEQITNSALTKVAAALQKQAVRDFGPLWGVQATVSAFVKLEDVPVGYWPIIVRNDIQSPGAAGVHEDKHGQPFALVQFDSGWGLTASHECLEMLADPFGNRLIAGPSVKKGQGRVEYLVEVCDPSEDVSFAYTVNGVLVSDFYTPHFFDPAKSSGARYSFTGAIQKPRQVLKGGYLSWHDPVGDHWWQQTYFGAKPKYRDLGVFGKLTGSLRSTIDRLTPVPPSSSKRSAVAAALDDAEVTAESTSARAKAWRDQIKAITKQSA